MFLMFRFFFTLALAVLVGGCGGDGGNPDTPRLYVARKSAATPRTPWDIEAFAIDSITGRLDPLDVHVDHGEERFTVQNLFLHPSGNHLVLGKRGSFAAMSIDSNGDLTLLPKEETAHRGSYHGQGAVVLHPDGRRIFVFSLPTRDSAAGTWVLKVNDAPPWFEMLGEASTPGCLGYAAAFDPTGDYLYCGSQHGEKLLTLSVDEITGSLNELATTPVKQFVRAIRYHPSGELVYVLSGEVVRDSTQRRNWTRWQPSWIAAYRRNPRNGHLNPVIRGAVTIDSMIADIALTPDGKYLYASDKNLGRVLGFRITATGQLEQLTKWARAGKAPVQLLVDPSSRFVYVTNTGGDSLSLFTILDTGNLAPMSGSPIALGGAPTAAIMVFPAVHD